MAAIVRELGDDGLLALTGKVGERTIDGAWVARHAVHDATHHLSDTGRDLYALVGVSAPPAFGSVESINVSDGGVPKRPVPEVVVGRRGLEGDRQRSRKHHGRVWQALCLYSIDVIEALQEEGHPIQAGSAGENLTLRGIDWVTMRPGVRLQLGDAVAELTVPATPCRHNAQWFTHGDFRRIDFTADLTSADLAHFQTKAKDGWEGEGSKIEKSTTGLPWWPFVWRNHETWADPDTEGRHHFHVEDDWGLVLWTVTTNATANFDDEGSNTGWSSGQKLLLGAIANSSGEAMRDGERIPTSDFRLLWGLFQIKHTAAGSSWRLLWIPFGGG